MTRSFGRFARRERIAPEKLIDAVTRAETGLVDAVLGGELIKQRVARAGAGRSGGYRTIIAVRSGTRAVFLYGFAKSERDNIDKLELASLREIAAGLLNATEPQINDAIAKNALEEVRHDSDQEEA